MPQTAVSAQWHHEWGWATLPYVSPDKFFSCQNVEPLKMLAILQDMISTHLLEHIGTHLSTAYHGIPTTRTYIMNSETAGRVALSSNQSLPLPKTYTQI